jgi:hypothetical protein
MNFDGGSPVAQDARCGVAISPSGVLHRHLP